MAVNIKSFNRVRTIDSANNELISGSQGIKFAGNVTTSISGDVVEVNVGVGSGVIIGDGVSNFAASEIQFLGNVSVVNNSGIGEVTIPFPSVGANLNGNPINSNTTLFNFVGTNIGLVDQGGGQTDVSVDTLTSYRLNGSPILNSQSVNFFGQVNVVNNGGVADVEILGSLNTVEEGGSLISNTVDTFNFIGATVTDQGGGQVDISINPNAPTAQPNTFTWFDGGGVLSGTPQEVSYVDVGANKAVFLLKGQGSNVNTVPAANDARILGIANDSNDFSSSNIDSAIVNTRLTNIVGAGSIFQSAIFGSSNQIEDQIRNSLFVGSNFTHNGGTIQDSVVATQGGTLSSSSSPSTNYSSSVVAGIGSENRVRVFNSFKASGASALWDDVRLEDSFVASGGTGGGGMVSTDIRRSFVSVTGFTSTNIIDSNIQNSLYINDINDTLQLNLNDSIFVSSGFTNVQATNNSLIRSLVVGSGITYDRSGSDSSIVALGENLDFLNTSPNLGSKFLIGGGLELNESDIIGKIGEGQFFETFISFYERQITLPLSAYQRDNALNSAPNTIEPEKTYNNIDSIAGNLITIDDSNVKEGTLVILVVESGGSKTVEHGTGNITLNGGANVTLTQGSTLSLIYNSSLASWLETSRSIV